MIKARVLAHSISADGIPLTSFEITAHRFVLAEVNTHRVFSRSFRSSRAVPIRKMIEEVRTNPAMPIHWGRNQSGMQAAEELTGDALLDAQRKWLNAAASAAHHAEQLAASGLHKQTANRVIEPFLWVHGVITSAHWANFFALRLDPTAQPEFRVLAEVMWDAQQASTPKLLHRGEWHLCYVTNEERGRYDIETLLKIDTARCARVSYAPFDGNASVEREIDRYRSLVVSRPVHSSPSEHQCTPDSRWFGIGPWRNRHQHGNTPGWIQHRKLIPHETVLDAFQEMA